MRVFRMLGASFRDGFKSVFRNFSLSLASISCITITLIIVCIAVIASFNVENFTKEIEKDMTIVVFLKTNASEEEIINVKQELGKIKNIESFNFKGKQEVKDEMSAESEVFKTIMESWNEEETPLKDTFQIKVKNILKIKHTAKKIEKMEEVSVVRYGEKMVDKMVNAFASIEKVAYGVVIALILVTTFLIINTIKLTIFSRKKEISIMRLVGASNMTIKLPFIIEGLFLGIMGSIIPILLATFGYLSFYKHFDGYLFSELIKLIKPEPFIYQTSGIILLIGIFVGMFGSAQAVRRYLKV